MKYLSTYILIVLLSVGTAYSQNLNENADSTAILQQQIKQLQDSIATLNDTLRNTYTKGKLLRERDKLLLENIVLDNRNEELQDKYDSIVKILSQTRDSLKNVSVNSDKRLQRITDSLNQIVSDHKNMLQQKNKQIRELETDVKDLNVFRQELLAQMAQSVDEKWCSQPFSQINGSLLVGECEKYNKFRSYDSRIETAYQKLTILKTDFNDYQLGQTLINSPYDGVAVAECAKKIDLLAKKIPGGYTAKKQEVAELQIQLNRYNIYVWTFKERIIPAFDKRIEEGKKYSWNQSAYMNPLSAELKILTEDIKAIKTNPWLKLKFEEYWRLLSTNCLAPNSVRDEIMNLKTN